MYICHPARVNTHVGARGRRGKIKASMNAFATDKATPHGNPWAMAAHLHFTSQLLLVVMPVATSIKPSLLSTLVDIVSACSQLLMHLLDEPAPRAHQKASEITEAMET
ncbi:unnamed protein product [Clonostachys chloroleuca]|uniref:Uncharacterized protein n=1 Tax=Clonostachys chloroleuca TaxID=1926264 RepID=A0AA35QEE2_9HYPO|nr:unnamed protein product [Clonostachys chloroleuca]